MAGAVSRSSRKPPAPDVSAEQAQLERLRRERTADTKAAQAYGRRPESPVDPQPPLPEPRTAAPARSPRPARKPVRRDPPGMTRRSLYLSTATFAALNEAAARVQDATSGILSKHEAVSILIDLASEHVDDAVTRARETLRQRLTGSSASPG